MEVKTRFLPNGNKIEERQFNSVQHNPDDPTFREWNGVSVLIREEYCFYGMLHNSISPTRRECREWNEAGMLLNETYWIDDKLHNSNGPSVRRWNGAGTLLHENYWLNGERHNSLGPAVNYYNDEGILSEKQYFLKGVMLKEDQWRNLTKPREIIAVISILHWPVAQMIIEHYCRA